MRYINQDTVKGLTVTSKPQSSIASRKHSAALCTPLLAVAAVAVVLSGGNGVVFDLFLALIVAVAL